MNKIEADINFILKGIDGTVPSIVKLADYSYHNMFYDLDTMTIVMKVYLRIAINDEEYRPKDI